MCVWDCQCSWEPSRKKAEIPPPNRTAHPVYMPPHSQTLWLQNESEVWEWGHIVACLSLSLSFSVLMTYHQLKRTNIIMSYIENARVLQGTVDLCKVPHTMLKPMGTLHYTVGLFHCSMWGRWSRGKAENRLWTRKLSESNGCHSQVMCRVYCTCMCWRPFLSCSW